MLNYYAKGSYTHIDGVVWTYYQDASTLNIFYVVPMPTWVLDGNNQPEIKLVEYQTDQHSGSGYVTFNAQLSVPSAVVTGVTNSIATRFPQAPKPYLINPFDYNPGCTAEFSLDVQGTVTNYLAQASEFGSNIVSFRADLDKTGMDTIRGLLTTAGGGLDVTYNLNVPAQLNAVTATLHFDSAIAYQYQVTQAQHHMYGGDTPRTVQKLLTESNSSSVKLQWGISNPSSDLVQSVTDWANATIAAQVSAEVNKALSLLSENSYDSFSINEVSSFTAVYASNQVVDWKLFPKASLASVANLTPFTTTVEKRQQVMTISAHLPFKGDAVAGANVPLVDAKPVMVQQLAVKVTYPGLSQADSTYVFTKNGPHTFTAPYSDSNGDSYDVQWTATYVDGSQQPVNGIATAVTAGEYVITLPSVGILSISFEAAPAFAPLTPAPLAVTSIDIDFHFADPSGGGNAIHQKQTVKAPPANPAPGKAPSTQVVFTSYTAHNVVTGTAYTYFVTYHFSSGPDFVGPETTSTSYNETIPAPPAPHAVPIIVYAAASKDAPVDVSVNVWFETDLVIPGAGPQPTKNNPTTFDLQPAQQGTGALFARDTFLGFLNGTIPLAYSATITTETTQIPIEPTRLENLQPSILVNATQRYITIVISMAAVDWTKKLFDQITLAITGKQTLNQVESSLPELSLFVFSPPPNDATSAPQYATWAIPLGATVKFSWIATYVKSGSGTTQAGGNGTDADAQIIVPAHGGTTLREPPRLFAVEVQG